nr:MULTISPECIES: hypothetical protein [Bartonella]
MLIPYLKKIALFGIMSILFTGHVSSQPLTEHVSSGPPCSNGQIAVFRDVQKPSSFITCISERMLDYISKEIPRGPFRIISIEEKDYLRILRRHFNKNNRIEWFVIGFIIITIMSLPINILWRFRLKISAFLFTIMTALAVIAIPYIYGYICLFEIYFFEKYF